MKVYHFDRTEPLKQFGDLSVFRGEASKTEYEASCLTAEEYVFPLALLTERDGEEIEVKTSLIYEGKPLPDRTSSFVTEGVDKFGVPFRKTLRLKADEYQPLYIGVDTTGITGNASLLVTLEGDAITAVRVKLSISERSAERMGDTEPKNLSRLRWLDSREAANGKVCKNYSPVAIEENKVKILGREIAFAPCGLPESAASYFEKNLQPAKEKQAEYFRDAVRFEAEGETFAYSDFKLSAAEDNAVVTANWQSERLSAELIGEIKYEGAIFYSVRFEAKTDYRGKITMTAPLSKAISLYNNGLGLAGGYFRDVDFRWNPLHQDSLFVGNVNAGLRLKWKAENYLRPLVNVYYKAQPLVIPETTWANGGNGKITAVKDCGAATVTADTGEYSLKKGEIRTFYFELHFTPFEPLDKEKQFGVRYYHSNRFRKIEKEIAVAKKHGLNYIVVHHGNEVHPFINYPFVETEAMQKLIRLAHAEGIKVKFYDTVRESSNHMAELFAYKAMGGEIILRKRFSGYGWMAEKSSELKKYFGEDIVSAWRVPFRRGKYRGQEDAAFIVRPDSRLDNYYIEGLKFLTEYFGADGIYIDDTALDRSVLERARKVLDANGGLIDMHMWNHEEERAGMASCANLYTEIFPFLDSLWIGEGFDVRKLPEDYVMTEVSGLLYGKPSQMLEGGGDPFCGMLYAMNNRYGWGVFNADKIYRLWDDFGIQDAELRGYWDEKNPFSATESDVKVTSYRNDDKILLAVYNFSSEKKKFALTGAENYRVEKPKVKGIQRSSRVDASAMTLKGRSGMFLLLRKK